jgi:hypothetical protein
VIGRLSLVASLLAGLGLTGCAGCASFQTSAIQTVSNVWAVGETHPEPCSLTSYRSGAVYVDADTQFWSIPTGVAPFTAVQPAKSCTDAGALSFIRALPVWISPPGVSTQTPMVEVSSSGVPVAFGLSPPKVRYYRDTSALAVTCVTQKIVSVLGRDYEPAPGHDYPPGHGPNCSLYATFTKQSDGTLVVLEPGGQQIELTPRGKSLSVEHGCG